VVLFQIYDIVRKVRGQECRILSWEIARCGLAQVLTKFSIWVKQGQLDVTGFVQIDAGAISSLGGPACLRVSESS
jgi:hypothetical protein